MKEMGRSESSYKEAATTLGRVIFIAAMFALERTLVKDELRAGRIEAERLQKARFVEGVDEGSEEETVEDEPSNASQAYPAPFLHLLASTLPLPLLSVVLDDGS